MTIHLYTGGPEVCFAAVDFTEDRSFDLFKIFHFIDGPAFRRLFLGETKSLKMSSFVTAVTSDILLQSMIAVCVAVHHTTDIYVRTLVVIRLRVSWLISNLFCEVPLNPHVYM